MFKSYSQVNAEVTVSPQTSPMRASMHEFTASLAGHANTFRCALSAGTSI